MERIAPKMICLGGLAGDRGNCNGAYVLNWSVFFEQLSTNVTAPAPNLLITQKLEIKVVFYRVCTLLIAVILSGCAGTQSIVNEEYSASSDDAFTIEILNTANATTAGLDVFESKLSTYDSVLKIGDPNPTRLVTIEFTYYSVRHGATRALVGVMAGSDNVTTVTTVQDATSGKTIGSVKHVTKNPTAVVGINFLLKGHADKIAQYLLSQN